EIRGLPENRRRSEGQAGTEHQADGGTGPGQPIWLLSLRRERQAWPGSGYGFARRHPTHCAGMAQLRPATHHSRTAKAWMEGKSETGLPPAARGQPAVRAEAKVCCDHRLQPRTEDLPEPGRRHGAHQRESTLAADITYI